MLATLGDQVFREADFQAYLAEQLSPEQIAAINQEPAERKKALEEYWNSVAILAKAHREGIDQQPRFRKALELMEMKLLSHLMTERYRDRVVRDSQVPPGMVETYYEQHQDELTAEPYFTARHLLVYVKGNPAFPDQGRSDTAARARAEEASARLRGGGSWDAIASEYSDDTATNRKGGLIRRGKFGYFAPEVERAVRTQELGKPGRVIRSVFGYHVLQVEERLTKKAPRPLDEVREMLTERLSLERSAAAREAFMTPLREAAGLEVAEAGKREVFLLDENAVAPDEVLARIGERRILESDFRWFLKDALIPEQRVSAYARPGARQGMLSSFLDMLVLEATARQDGADRSVEFLRARAAMERKLLTEFMQQRDQAGPFCRCGDTAEERQQAEREYFRQLRAEIPILVHRGGA